MKVCASWSIWSRSVSVILPCSDRMWLGGGGGGVSGRREGRRRGSASRRLRGCAGEGSVPAEVTPRRPAEAEGPARPRGEGVWAVGRSSGGWQAHRAPAETTASRAAQGGHGLGGACGPHHGCGLDARPRAATARTFTRHSDRVACSRVPRGGRCGHDLEAPERGVSTGLRPPLFPTGTSRLRHSLCASGTPGTAALRNSVTSPTLGHSPSSRGLVKASRSAVST